MVREKEIEARAVTAFVRALSEPGAAVGDRKPAIANVNINYVVRAALEAAREVKGWEAVMPNKQITDEMVEAGAKALGGDDWITCVHDRPMWRREAKEVLEAALSVAARVRAEANAEGGDGRPADCRSRLQEEGKPYPRSGCRACGASIRSGLRCPYAHPASQPSGTAGVLEIAKKTRNLTFNVLTMDEHIHFVQEVLALTAGKPEPVPSGTVEALKRIAQLKEVRRGGGVFDYEPALSAMEMYEIAFDALSALTAGKSEQAVPGGWQPIETAPKDGTDILGWHEIAGTSQTCFSKGEWVCPDWDEDRYIHCTWSPTHWMPLPTPPTAGGGDE